MTIFTTNLYKYLANGNMADVTINRQQDITISLVAATRAAVSG